MSESTDNTFEPLLAEHEGTRTWMVWAPTRDELVKRVALTFAEHIDDDDEVHVAYNAMQSGWREHPPSDQEHSAFTELLFEYSALIVVRRASGRTHRRLTEMLDRLIEHLDRD